MILPKLEGQAASEYLIIELSSSQKLRPAWPRIESPTTIRLVNYLQGQS